MKVHPQVIHTNGIVTVTLQASFIGDAPDHGDQQRISAYGDPKINIAGLFSDPADPSFSFTFPASEMYVGVTTDLQNHAVRFMTALPLTPPSGSNWNPFASTTAYNPFATSASGTQQGDLDCVVTDPVRAATVWAAAVDSRVQTAMTVLRAKNPAQLTNLPDSTI